MLQHIEVGERALEAYRGIAPDEQLEALIAQAKPLRGVKRHQSRPLPHYAYSSARPAREDVA